MAATGMERQERKIQELAEIVRTVDDGLALLSVKGVFRLGIEAALKGMGLDAWKQVADRPVAEKRAFFEALCADVVPRLERLGFPEARSGELLQRLRTANEAYMA